MTDDFDGLETTSVFDLVMRLDAILTGASAEETLRTRNHEVARLGGIVEWVSSQDGYYLSDGGYSRLHANDEGRVWLGSVSTDRAKSLWTSQEAGALVSAISAKIRDLVGEAMTAEGSTPATFGEPGRR